MTDGVNASIGNSAISSLSSGTSTATSSDISLALKTQLAELGIDTTNITSSVEAKKAIAVAEAKVAEEKAAETPKQNNEIKDTVEVSKKALDLNNLKSITVEA